VTVVVLGAGVAGLSAAIHAASTGARVVLVEAGEVGGKLGRITRDGYTFDTGPSLLTLPWVFEDLFRVGGTTLAAELELLRVDPICRYLWPDGGRWDFASDLATTLAGLRELAPGQIPGFLSFLADSSRRYEWGGPPFLAHPSDGLLALTRRILAVAPGPAAMGIAPLSTVESVARSFFTDPRLVQWVGRYATYVGGSPAHTPSPFAMMPYVEAGLGAWHPRGGMHRIAEALLGVALRMGVTLDRRAARGLERDGGKVVAVHLAAGADTPERIACDAVVSTLGWEETHTRLLPDVPSTARPRSLSGLVWLVGLRATLPGVLHHTLLFSRDYPREFVDLAQPEPSWADPTVYLCASTRTDPSGAPPGGENLFIMLNAPVDRGQDWDALAARGWAQVRARLAEHGLDWDPADEQVRNCLAPADLARRTGALGGAIYGESADGFRDALFRRPNRHPTLDNLGFAGGGVHPGGGVPLAALSGGHAIRALGLR